MTETFVTIVVPAANVEAYRQLAETWAGGQGMFRRQCLTGETVTHYISTGLMDAAVVTLFQHPDIFAQLVTDLCGGITAEEAEALRAAADIRQDAPEVALARNGLTLGDIEE